jgi:hypothetical protein
MKILVFGGSSKLGGAIIAGLREVYGRDVYILATTSGRTAKVPLANATLHIQLKRENVLNNEWIKPLLVERPYDMTFFMFAFSSATGKPWRMATAAEKQEAMDFSFVPLLKMERWGGFGRLVAATTFWQMPLVKKIYGAVLEPKRQLESWHLEDPLRRQLFRISAYESRSLRAVMLMAERWYRAHPSEMPQLFPHVPNFAHMTFAEALAAELRHQEKKYFGSTGATSLQYIQAAIVGWLKQPKPVIINVAGNQTWEGYRLRPVTRQMVSELRQLAAAAVSIRRRCKSFARKTIPGQNLIEAVMPQLI